MDSGVKCSFTVCADMTENDMHCLLFSSRVCRAYRPIFNKPNLVHNLAHLFDKRYAKLFKVYINPHLATDSLNAVFNAVLSHILFKFQVDMISNRRPSCCLTVA